MKKYKLFIDVTLVLLCLFPLIFSCIVFFYNNNGTFDGLYQIVSQCEIVPSFTVTFKEIFTAAFNVGSDPVPAFDIFCVIISNSIFIYIGYVFVEVLVFVPKMAIRLLRIFVRKED